MKLKYLLLIFFILLTSCTKQKTEDLGSLVVSQEPQQQTQDEFEFEESIEDESTGLRLKKVKLFNYGLDVPIPLGYEVNANNPYYTYFSFPNSDRLQYIEIGITEIPNYMILPRTMSNVVENGEEYVRNNLEFHHNTGRTYTVNEYFPLTDEGERAFLYGDREVFVPYESAIHSVTPYTELDSTEGLSGIFAPRNNLIGEKLSVDVKLGGQGSGNAYLNILFSPRGYSEYIISVLSPTTSRELNDEIFDAITSDITFLRQRDEISGVSYTNSDFFTHSLVLPRNWQESSNFMQHKVLINTDISSVLFSSQIYLFPKSLSPEENIQDYILRNIFEDAQDIISNQIPYTIDNVIHIETTSSFDYTQKASTAYPCVIAYKEMNLNGQDYILAVTGRPAQENLIKSLVKTIH